MCMRLRKEKDKRIIPATQEAIQILKVRMFYLLQAAYILAKRMNKVAVNHPLA